MSFRNYVENLKVDTKRLLFLLLSFNFRKGTYQINTEVKKGINIIGFPKLPKGVGEGVRSHIKAANTVGLKNSVIDVNDLAFSDELYDYNLFHINADLIPQIYVKLGKKFWEKRYNIGYWVWELEKFPKKWKSSFRYLDEIWVGSSFVYDALKEITHIPILKIPYSIEFDVDTQYNRSYFNLPKSSFLFLSMYDTESIQERKNPKASIEAFQKVFAFNNKKVCLIIKINNNSLNSLEIENLKKMIYGWENIILINKVLKKEEVTGLINCCDVFISLHRSEGFGLVIAESMYLGKPVIVTNWSGNTDFTNFKNACCVPYKLIEIKKSHGPYKKGNYWAEPDILAASNFMIKLYENKGYYAEKSISGNETIKSYYSSKYIGSLIKKRIDELNNKKLKDIRIHNKMK
jgi:glycosyltransferase involved in cell wall biosynthesis